MMFVVRDNTDDLDFGEFYDDSEYYEENYNN